MGEREREGERDQRRLFYSVNLLKYGFGYNASSDGNVHIIIT